MLTWRWVRASCHCSGSERGDDHWPGRIGFCFGALPGLIWVESIDAAVCRKIRGDDFDRVCLAVFFGSGPAAAVIPAPGSTEYRVAVRAACSLLSG